MKTGQNHEKCLIQKTMESLPKTNRTIEQQDNESLNTMDYYKEDNNSRNKNIEEIKFSPKSILDRNNNSKTIDTNEDSLISKYNFYCKQDIPKKSKNKKICIPLNRSFFCHKTEKNIQKRLEDKKMNNEYCIRCNSEIKYSTKVCPHCLKPLCRKCLKQIFNRNLDNNDDFDNFDQNLINEKICPNCRNKTCINDFVSLESNQKSNLTAKINEPLDSPTNSDNSTLISQGENNSFISKDLEDHFNEYNLLMNEIEEKKKEIEIKKDLNLNILQLIKKTIEFEYNNNMNKLNEICLKLKTIQNTFNDKKNKINKYRNFDNTFELKQINEEFRKKISNFSKYFEKVNQRLFLKLKPKAYKSYESKKLSLNLSDTYGMKFTEILSNQYIGNTFIKVDRYIKNYVNYLNFSILIRQNNKESQNNNVVNNPKFVVNMIINNKLFKLIKTKKNNNQLGMNYEYSLEESSIFAFKNQSNSTNTIMKKDEFDVKVIITELFL